MRGDRGIGEEELARIEREKNPAAIDELVRTIRQQQRELDSLRLGIDVARSDREELRAALIECQRRVKGEE